jgi:AcrR family transcriptional regulator
VEIEQPLRADARRNAATLTAVARAAIAAEGLDVSTNEIVKRAGVGAGTFYRRFPSRQVLLETILLETIGELEAQAQAALACADPARGFADLLRALAVSQANNKGLAQALSADGGSDAVDRARIRLRDLIREVTERGQAASVLRPDLSWRDVPFLASAVAGMTGRCLDLDGGPQQRDRVLGFVLDGLRTPGLCQFPTG